MERLAALEAEVKADAAKKQAAKDAALAKLRAQKDEQQKLRDRQLALVAKKPTVRGPDDDGDAGLEEIGRGGKSDLGSTLALAKRASDMKEELARRPGAGEKSWVTSGLASMLLGPLGWLYAGSFREAIPASAAWLVFAAIASHLPSLLLMPVLMVAMPLSGIAGAVYAVKYNRKGARQRIFGKQAAKALPAAPPAKKR